MGCPDFLIIIEKKRKVIYNKGISISVRRSHQYTVTNSAITSCLMNSFAIDDAIFLNDGKVLNKIKIHSIQVCIISALLEKPCIFKIKNTFYM